MLICISRHAYRILIMGTLIASQPKHHYLAWMYSFPYISPQKYMRSVLFDPILRESEMIKPLISPWTNLNLTDIIISYLIPLAIIVIVAFILKYMYQKRREKIKVRDDTSTISGLSDVSTISDL